METLKICSKQGCNNIRTNSNVSWCRRCKNQAYKANKKKRLQK